MCKYSLFAGFEDKDKRLDKFLSENIEEMTRTRLTALIDRGDCTVYQWGELQNGGIQRDGGFVSPIKPAKNYKMKPGDEAKITVPVAEPAELDEALPENIPLDIVYEDSDVIVVNKPRGMVVHPSNGHQSGTLVNALMHHCKTLSAVNCQLYHRPGIVHRLDKDTSGLIVIAKNDVAHLSLAEQLKNRTKVREYEAVVHGRVKQQSGEVNAPIGRSVSDRKKMCVTVKNSREAVTRYEVIADYGQFTHLRLKLCTGRTHQIRVHMAYMGHSVAGDAVYGNGKPQFLNGQCLHAVKLGFVHPGTGEYVEFESRLPEYFTDFLRNLQD
ncbi:MAG: RluA family pseudouridine synthase [Oscillospiraceae bacterium]|nr:RluA family pseudouridine synthase [Oscillospiraceae bacterium]